MEMGQPFIDQALETLPGDCSYEQWKPAAQPGDTLTGCYLITASWDTHRATVDLPTSSASAISRTLRPGKPQNSISTMR